MGKLIERLLKEGESLTVEFKSERRRPLSDDEIVESVTCLANREGGYLLIGVEDNGNITGARPYPRHEKDIKPQMIRAMIYGRTRPHLWVDVWIEEMEGHQIVIIKVPATIITATSTGKYLIRSIGGDGKPGCFPLEPHEIMSLLSYMGNVDITAQVLDIEPDVLDEESIDLIIEKIRSEGSDELSSLPKEEMLRILGILTRDMKVTIAGILICGKREIISEIVPGHEVIINEFRGIELKDQKTYKTSLIKIFHILMEEFERKNHGIGEILKKGIRYEIPLLEEGAFREIVANALIHRDYTTYGAVTIDWYEDGRLRVANPGGFVRGVSIDNILSVPPSPRNPLLSEIFRRMGIVEKTGRGVDRIYTGQAIYGKPLPIWSVDSHNVSITLIGHEWDRSIAQTLVGENLMPEEILLTYLILKSGKADLKEASRFIQRNKDETLYFLRMLEKKEFISIQGNIISRAEKTGERLDQKRLIIELLKEKGWITRSDVMKLLGVSAPTASRILRKLMEEGTIEKTGKGPLTKYTLKITP